jgi:hypothetical protein
MSPPLTFFHRRYRRYRILLHPRPGPCTVDHGRRPRHHPRCSREGLRRRRAVRRPRQRRPRELRPRQPCRLADLTAWRVASCPPPLAALARFRWPPLPACTRGVKRHFQSLGEGGSAAAAGGPARNVRSAARPRPRPLTPPKPAKPSRSVPSPDTGGHHLRQLWAAAASRARGAVSDPILPVPRQWAAPLRPQQRARLRGDQRREDAASLSGTKVGAAIPPARFSCLALVAGSEAAASPSWAPGPTIGPGAPAPRTPEGGRAGPAAAQRIRPS